MLLRRLLFRQIRKAHHTLESNFVQRAHRLEQRQILGEVPSEARGSAGAVDENEVVGGLGSEASSRRLGSGQRRLSVLARGRPRPRARAVSRFEQGQARDERLDDSFFLQRALIAYCLSDR